jgi:hypothetical protein
VHITGDVEKSPKNSISIARQTVIDNLDTIQRFYMSQVIFVLPSLRLPGGL